jgi:hypothetical protein
VAPTVVKGLMSTSTLIPVSITPEAQAFVDRLGQRAELERLIDRARQVVPGLRTIEVALDEATEEIPAGLILWAHRDGVGEGDDPTHRDWIDWMASTFPPDTCRNFSLLSVYHDDER